MEVSSSSPFAVYSSEYDDHIMDVSNQIISKRYGGRLNQSTILTYSDRSEWVVMPDRYKERFCGYLYLQQALRDNNIDYFEAATNKMAIHDRKIIYLSKYVGEEMIDARQYEAELDTLMRITGFVDYMSMDHICNNLRKKDGNIYIFDTEKSSFAASILEKIDTFASIHDAVQLSLVKKLPKVGAVMGEKNVSVSISDNIEEGYSESLEDFMAMMKMRYQEKK